MIPAAEPRSMTRTPMPNTATAAAVTYAGRGEGNEPEARYIAVGNMKNVADVPMEPMRVNTRPTSCTKLAAHTQASKGSADSHKCCAGVASVSPKNM